ncbi:MULTISPECIES: lactococcin family bacteriocin [Leuconostoc]|jgi:bacteriocin-like protein|uniref:Mesentericin B105 n=3 Tax=Leuconostoc mesenteroides TaxID=1245 RepID=Q7X5J4_LEUMS|nr:MULTISPECIES: lactococcin family bacteriocin [Leuconostoc]AAD54223.1 mesentericin B105 [Leuconostoc mesenteroides]AAP37401.1 mesentericin B105 precursor [Leuconostoc mesenteroides subsp. mesenteroides]KAA8325672.1 lactococcin family bacteriocin [Leuconostoc carnosum]MBS0943220.1 lactococcin family bacteriocin [Leuconostoc mesenteroides]MBZ1510602.1 lactococcin family bacteriocin [Leuconostoc mesenteroides]
MQDKTNFKILSDSELSTISGGKGVLGWLSMASSALTGPQQPNSPWLAKIKNHK